jgi:HK97 family phage major capsid protein
MAGININRTSGFNMPTEMSDEIIANTIESSVVQRLARRIPLGGRGESIPVITGDAEAAWAAETDAKAVSTATLGTKIISSYTLAVIEPFSKQFLRDDSKLYRELVNRLAPAIGKKFDQTVFGVATAPGSAFDTLAAASGVDIQTDTVDNLIDAKTAISLANGLLDGFVLSPQAEAILLKTRDAVDRPVLVSSLINDGNANYVLGARTYASRYVYKPGNASSKIPNQLGFAGDWSSTVWGTVGGVSIDVSDQATVGDINLWARNMFAVRAEVEIAFGVTDIAKFVKLTDTPPS